MSSARIGALFALLLSACVTNTSNIEPPEPDPYWPERIHPSIFGALPTGLPVEYVLNGDFRVRLESGRRVTVRDHAWIGIYAPDLHVITLEQPGYHGMGADSETVAVHLLSGARLTVDGFITSTPRRDLLLRDESGMLYEGGSISVVRVTQRGFERLGGGRVEYAFEPTWVSPTCVEFRPGNGEPPSAHLAEAPSGRWARGEGRCPS